MRDVNLENADLSGADLSGADLSDADLEGANLTGANLEGTILEDNSLLEEEEDFNNTKIEDLVDLEDDINELTQGVYLKKESYTRKEFLMVLDYCFTYYDAGGYGEALGGKIERRWRNKINQDAPIKVKLARGEEMNFYPDFVELDSYKINPGFKYISYFPMNLGRAKYLMDVLRLLEGDSGFRWGLAENPREPDEEYDGFFDFYGA